jgi:hypothetical protein
VTGSFALADTSTGVLTKRRTRPPARANDLARQKPVAAIVARFAGKPQA